MKYRDPKTGEVFEDIIAARDAYCEHIRPADCHKCPLNSNNNGTDGDMDCVAFADASPTVAARLMGLEVVTEEEEPMEKKDKPRICEVLGVEVGERFDLPVPYRYYRDCYVTADARVCAGMQKIGDSGLCWLYEHPDSIIRKPRFTQEEIEDARAVRRFYPDAATVHRTQTGNVLLADAGNVFAGKLPAKLFPSLRPGQSLRLEDVLESRA